MKTKCKHHRIVEVELNQEEFLEMRDNLRGATLHETCGPLWKNIYWFRDRPFVDKNERTLY